MTTSPRSHHDPNVPRTAMPTRRRKTALYALVASLAATVGTVAFLSRNPVDRPASATPSPSVSHESGAPHPTSDPSSRVSHESAARLAAITATELAATEGVWAVEQLADSCGQVFERYWDAVRAATNKLAVAADFHATEWILPAWEVVQQHPHDIQEHSPSPTGSAVSGQDWHDRVSMFQEDGWALVTTEFRHTRFDTNAAGQPRQSTFQFSAHLNHAPSPRRAQIRGDLIVDWTTNNPAGAPPTVSRIDASRLSLLVRDGEPPFRLILEERIATPRHGQSVDPLILHDLDGDGLSEIILAGRNLVYRRNTEGRYVPSELLRYPADVVYAAVMGDFDGDGHTDFLCQTYRGLELMRGSPGGRFETPGEVVWPKNPEVRFPMVLTCGDIDHDGDLDVFLGQYKDPYEGGAIPTPYFDARNGNPYFLLLNDGHGRFVDATESSGLGPKRGRRVYSASFVDMDGDGHLDLIAASDFAGVDLFHNDGHGKFSDVTARTIPEPHGFGMAHALSDFNADGRLDLLMIGMTSPTVDRLEHLGLHRPGLQGDASMRPAMAHGNRLLLAEPGGLFREGGLSRSIQRSGWSWGCGVADFDNDGWPDVYIGNGLESKQTVREYESEYWLHNLFVGTSGDDPGAYFYLLGKSAQTRGRGYSYGGFEKNRFHLNLDGKSFLEAGHLMGMALEQDSRNVVVDDLDGDGQPDLIVTSFESWPDPKQTLRIYRNELRPRGSWIGFRFEDTEGEGSPVGVRIEIETPRGRAIRTLVTGDSYRSQSANTVHFGLGQSTGNTVGTVRISWPGGPVVTLKEQAANRYHPIRRPKSVRSP